MQYGLGLRVIHWLTVVAILGLIDTSMGGKEHSIPASGTPSMQWHYAAGIAVLLLTIVRLVLRIDMQRPPIVPTPGALMAITARLVLIALYIFLIVEPLLGWLQVSYGGGRIILPALGWHLPALVHPDPQAEDLAGELHEIIGNVFYGVIALHVLAALWHHFVRRDNALKRML